MNYFYLFSAIFILLGILVFSKLDRRSLIYGFLFISWLSILSLLTFYISFHYKMQLIVIVFVIVAFIVVITLIFLPLICIFTLLYNGYLIIKKEGFSFFHSLSFLSGIGLILYIFIFPLFYSSSNIIIQHIYVFIAGVASYLLFIFVVYAFSSILNLINLNTKNLDYIVVLGSGLINNEVTPLLKSRIDKGIYLLNKQKHDCKIIFSGGQGEDENIPEGLAMYNYAITKGVYKEKCIVEDKSVNTYENIKYSYNLMENKSGRICLVTTSFHVFRSLLIARSQKIKCIGVGSKTKFYYTINAFIREFIGYLSISRKIHITFFVLFIFLNILLMIVNKVIL